MQKRITVFFLLFFLTLRAVAASFDFCVPVPYKVDNHAIVLLTSPSPEKPAIYFFTNISKHSIFIDHLVRNPGASAGWATYLRPGNWSALVLNKKNFTVLCSMIQPGKVVPLDCAKTLVVCGPKNLQLRTSFKGNVWLVEDKDWQTFAALLKKRGVTF